MLTLALRVSVWILHDVYLLVKDVHELATSEVGRLLLAQLRSSGSSSPVGLAKGLCRRRRGRSIAIQERFHEL